MVPLGCLLPFAGAGDVPDGYLLADGQAVSRTEYLGLFQVLGETWGPGDGLTTFNIPDLRRRVPVGTGTGTAQLGGDVGDLGGAEVITLTEAEMPEHVHDMEHSHLAPDHTHGLNNHTHTIPDHAHNIDFKTNNGVVGAGNTYLRANQASPFSTFTTNSDGGGGATSGPSTTNTELGGEGETGNNVPDDTQPTGGDGAHDNFQPSAVVQWIIKALPDEPPPPPVEDSAGMAPYTLFNSLFE